jgi:hypothetical protein
MMNWIPLSKIAISEKFSRKLRDEANKLNTRIEDALRGRADFEKIQTRILREDPVALSSDDLFAASELGTLEYQRLQQEHKLLEDLDRFHEQWQAEVRAQCTKAYEGHQAARAKVEADLLAIGFKSSNPNHHPAGQLAPGMITAHPAVLAAQREYDALHRIAGDPPPNHTRDLQAIKERLEAIRRQRAK